jgi:hypothetical protein
MVAMRNLKSALLVVSGALALSACGTDLYEDEVGQATGDVMASFDDASAAGSFASLRYLNPGVHDFLKPGILNRSLDLLIPNAYADECTSLAFSACSNSQRSRSATDCTYGPWTLNGDITLTFSESTCSMMNINDVVTRTADYQITGPRGATLAVTSPGGGQVVTRTGAAAFTYQVLGMERIATEASGKKLFDISTQTSSDIGVTGDSRSTRVMNGGDLVVTHHLAGYTATISPNNVTWSAGCNCAVSGSWTGTATGSVTGAYTVLITGCGTATVTASNGYSKDIQFDRCSSI